MRAAFLIVALALPALAQPATLRTTVRMEAPVIRVGDLWENAGANAHVVLGPAPAPGRHVVVERRQLEHIARLHNVDWQGGSTADRTIIETPGRAVPREAVMERLVQALEAAGAEPDSRIEMGELVLPMVPPGTEPALGIEDARVDQASGRFSAMLVIAGEGPSQRLRLVGRAVATRPVLVAARRLGAGTVLTADDLRVERWPTVRARAEHASEAAPLLGRVLRRAVAAGQPVPAADTAALPAVAAGSNVTVVMEAGGLSLSMQGIALAAAQPGERVAVRNTGSGTVVQGTVEGPGRVRVQADQPARAAR